ncbi:MAG: TetR/AcrR family transcriptional regulator [Planctomycetota bacterium]|nr:TetR/AcrR family transcriptional regulator [Planctomycetota bacterium]
MNLLEKRKVSSTKDRLLEAAEIEFALGGFDGAKLADIAKRVGIRRPSLLYHFPSKTELYKATVERAFEQLGQTLGFGMSSSGTFRDRLQAVTERFSAFLEKRPFLARLVIREFLSGDGPGRAILLSKVAPLLDFVETFIEGEGRELVRGSLPIRAAIMSSVSNILLKNASGGLQEALWGSGDHSWTLTRFVFFEKEV